jgi:hypothetical protein
MDDLMNVRICDIYSNAVGSVDILFTNGYRMILRIDESINQARIELARSGAPSTLPVRPIEYTKHES